MIRTWAFVLCSVTAGIAGRHTRRLGGLVIGGIYNGMYLMGLQVQ